MAFNPLAAIGTGLARGAGNYSQIMLADRLKKEAEARDLAARQQLALENFEREKELRQMLARMQNRQQLASEERQVRGEANRAIGQGQAVGLPGLGAASLLNRPGAFEALGGMDEANKIIGQITGGVSAMQQKEAGRDKRFEAIAKAEADAQSRALEARRVGAYEQSVRNQSAQLTRPQSRQVELTDGSLVEIITNPETGRSEISELSGPKARTQSLSQEDVVRLYQAEARRLADEAELAFNTTGVIPQEGTDYYEIAKVRIDQALKTEGITPPPMPKASPAGGLADLAAGLGINIVPVE